MAEVSADNWSANSKYRPGFKSSRGCIGKESVDCLHALRCFFAAQQYYLLNSSSPEEARRIYFKHGFHEGASILLVGLD